MLSVVIPALNAAAGLGAAIEALRRPPWGHQKGEIVVVDGSSSDATVAVAERHGARVLTALRGRGAQLVAGAAAARGEWLLFLHADTVLSPDWMQAAQEFMRSPASADRAGAFAFALDDPAPEARRVERLVAWRCRRLGLPYGDQGLLIARDFYRRLGGYRPLPLMEDVDLVRRIGRGRIAMLPATALTSAERWRRDGWTMRSARNLLCLGLYFAGLPPRLIAKLY